MSENQHIKNEIKKNKKIWLIVSIILICSTFIVRYILYKNEFFYNNLNLNNILFIACLLSNVFIITYLYIHFIIGPKKLMNIRPIKCIIEDVIILTYKGNKENRRKYACLLIRNTEDNNLYITYGANDFSSLTVNYTKVNRAYKNFCVLRNDKSCVQLGDIAYMYLKEKYDVKLRFPEESQSLMHQYRKKLHNTIINNSSIHVSLPSIDNENLVIINGKKYIFVNANTNYNRRILEQVIFYKGAIDIERY